MSEDGQTNARDEIERVPVELPPMRTDTPRPVRTVRGLRSLPGMVGLWFMPGRVGPALTASGWWAALAAHLLALTLGFGLIAYALISRAAWGLGAPGVITFQYNVPESGLTVSEGVRAPFATLALVVHAHAAAPGSVGKIVLILAVIAAIVLVLTLITMPSAAAGEHLGLLFGRCLRLTLWSTTMLIPLGIGWLLWPLILDRLGLAPPPIEPVFFGTRPEVDDPGRPLTLGALVAFAIWWLIVLFRSGRRYAGPPDGPSWRPESPRCAKCRYIIAGIALDSRCPECGEPVAPSSEKCRRSLKFSRRNAFVRAVRDLFRKE